MQSTYLYLLTRGFNNGPNASAGAVHAIDLDYLFGSFAAFGDTPDADACAVI